MNRLNSDFLRLVTEDETPIAVSPPAFSADWGTLCESFTTATGLPFHFRPSEESLPAEDEALWSIEVPATGPFAPGRLILLDSKSRRSVKKSQASRDLAQHIGTLVADLHDVRRTLWQREAELATAIPLVVHPAEEQQQLAARFESILEGGAEAIGCHAAAMYILDDATRHLKMRSHWGLSHARFTAPPRPLRTARADIEALAGHAVTLSNISECESWDVPEPFAAGVCVPISTATVPLGTLWIFSDEVREFSDAEVNLAEIIAGRFAVELEREILLREHRVIGNSSKMAAAIDWQQDWLPRTPLVLDDWYVAARPSTRSRLHGDYYHWRMDSAGNLSFMLSTAHADGVPAALTTATIAGLVHRAEADLPQVRLDRVNELLYASSTGDRQATMFCGRLSPQGGGLEFASAGEVQAYVIRPHGWESLETTEAQPAGGWSPEAQCPAQSSQIEPGDILLVVSGKPRHRPRLLSDSPIDGTQYAETLLHHPHLPVDEMVTLLGSQWEHGQTVWDVPPAILVAKRRG